MKENKDVQLKMILGDVIKEKGALCLRAESFLNRNNPCFRGVGLKRKFGEDQERGAEGDSADESTWSAADDVCESTEITPPVTPPLVQPKEEPEVLNSAEQSLPSPRAKSSGYRGITRRRRGWEAHVWRHGKQAYLGGYNEEKDAARAYDMAVIKIRGMNSETNFPSIGYVEDLKRLRADEVSVEEFIVALREEAKALTKRQKEEEAKRSTNMLRELYLEQENLASSSKPAGDVAAEQGAAKRQRLSESAILSNLQQLSRGPSNAVPNSGVIRPTPVMASPVDRIYQLRAPVISLPATVQSVAQPHSYQTTQSEVDHLEMIKQALAIMALAYRL